MADPLYRMTVNQVLMVNEPPRKPAFAGVRIKIMEPRLYLELKPFTTLYETAGMRFSPVLSLLTPCCLEHFRESPEGFFCRECSEFYEVGATTAEEVGDWTGAVLGWLTPHMPPLEAQLLSYHLQDDFETLNQILTDVFKKHQKPLDEALADLEAAFENRSLLA